ncbi:hypothetical protein GHYDROH2_03660 [Geobacter hydrogenophilus]|uniref:Uncharacterized protein n=1 Tax=Geobacter hydrogenophilus TaxID=40983 RepID=A0A9W6FXW8_9BACT|nr:hypothetical protein GHYDROH2_03660 [Geobacter hydrogenophilus]
MQTQMLILKASRVLLKRKALSGKREAAVITFRNLFLITGLAFLAVLPLGILAIHLPSGFNSIYLYATASILVSWLYLYSLRRLLDRRNLVLRSALGAGLSR